MDLHGQPMLPLLYLAGIVNLLGFHGKAGWLPKEININYDVLSDGGIGRRVRSPSSRIKRPRG